MHTENKSYHFLITSPHQKKTTRQGKSLYENLSLFKYIFQIMCIGDVQVIWG